MGSQSRLQWNRELQKQHERKETSASRKIQIRYLPFSKRTWHTKSNPKLLKDEIMSKVNHHVKIDNLKFTRDNKIVITTSSIDCALEVCKITKFLNIHVTPTIQRDCTSKRFLLRNIPVDTASSRNRGRNYRLQQRHCVRTPSLHQKIW